VDGAPQENLYGSDLLQSFIDLGYELFRDKATLKSKFIAADVFDPDSELKQLDEQLGIIYATCFFHLFDWNQQVAIGKRFVKLLKPEPGALILGYHVGQSEPSELQALTLKGKMYRHNVDTWEKMWQQIGDETGTRWDVKAELFSGTANYTWMPLGSGIMKFQVRRL
jgi:hypothetical protein